MPKTAKEILENGLNNDILSFKKMLDTYSYSMGPDNPDKEKLEEISKALGNIMKTNNAIEIEENLAVIGDIEGFLKEEKNGKSVYDTLTEKMSGVAKEKFDKLLNSVNGQFGYGVTDDVIKDNEHTVTQDKINEEKAREKEEEKEEKEQKEKEEKEAEKDNGKDKDKEEFLRVAKENGWDSEEEQKFLSDLYDAHKTEEDPTKKKKLGDIMEQVSTVRVWNLDKKYGVLGMWSDQIKALFSKGEAVASEDIGNDIIEGKPAPAADKKETPKPEKEPTPKAEKERENDSPAPMAGDTPWRIRTNYTELAREEYGPSFGQNAGLTERVRQKERTKEMNTPTL
ncbi:MAG: hypothetical protein K6F90_07885 [Lachnospiraceae bacterium]|nr:hypothetical protein [Lachnospiraceae bacterium]